jgi:hypothetical protein
MGFQKDLEKQEKMAKKIRNGFSKKLPCNKDEKSIQGRTGYTSGRSSGQIGFERVGR